MRKNTLTSALLTHSMMTPVERAMGRFMRAPDGHGDGGKTFTQEQLDAAVSKATGDIDGLKAKVEELIGDKKKLTAELRKVSDIKPEDVAAIEKERDDLAEKLKAAEKAAKDATTAAEKATKALTDEQGFTHQLLVENGLREQLAANGVTSAIHQKYAMAELAKQVQVTADGSNRIAKVGDKALADFVKEWASGAEGKEFVSAPINSGGGAPGGTKDGGSGKSATRAEFDAMDQGARMNFSKEGGKVVDATT